MPFSKQPNNALNVHLITKIQAKSQKSRQFSPNARISGQLDYTAFVISTSDSVVLRLFNSVILAQAQVVHLSLKILYIDRGIPSNLE